jgi:hypothetical protein
MTLGLGVPTIKIEQLSSAGGDCSRSIIVRSMNELEERNVSCIPAVHDLRADHTFCCTTFALGNFRTRYRVKGSAMWAEKGVAFQNWPDVRHTDLRYSEPQVLAE